MAESLLVQLYEGMVDEALSVSDERASIVVRPYLCATREEGDRIVASLKSRFPFPFDETYLPSSRQSTPEYVQYVRAVRIEDYLGSNREEVAKSLLNIAPRKWGNGMSLDKIASFIVSE